MFLNISDELKEELKHEAEEKGLSLTSYIRMILMERNGKENDKK
jgi:predicted DNA binding CopG/RHH family protein